MVMYDNEYKTEKNKKLTKDETEAQVDSRDLPGPQNKLVRSP